MQEIIMLYAHVMIIDDMLNKNCYELHKISEGRLKAYSEIRRLSLQDEMTDVEGKKKSVQQTCARIEKC